MILRLLCLTLLGASAAVVGFIASAHHSARATGEAEVSSADPKTAPEPTPDCCCAQVSRLSLLTASAATETAQEPAVELKAIKLPELMDAIKDQPGKLVIVDLWADF